eukprot:SAG25_NODE_1072_length_4113_cov_13.119581_4_plen_68_part_01
MDIIYPKALKMAPRSIPPELTGSAGGNGGREILLVREAEVTQKEVEDAHMQAVDDAKQHETQLVETRA